MRSRFTYLLAPAAALVAMLALSGCVAYPAYDGGYYGPSATVVVPVAPRPYWGGGWGWGHRGWR